MKFNPQLKQQIEEYEKNRHAANDAGSAGKMEQVKVPFYDPLGARRGEKVAGGDILWKPVDKLAAKMLWRSGWLEKPPQTTTINQKPKEKNMQREKSYHDQQATSKPGDHLMPNGEVLHVKSRDEQTRELVDAVIKRSVKAVDQTTELLDKALDARAALDMLANQWKTQWLDFQDTCNSRLTELRQTRFAMDSEMRQILTMMRDMRKFFLEDDYAVERARLKDFMETCERLKALKDSGFLDTVADTMLNLASKAKV